MSDAYTGEIRVFAGNFAPYGWAFCNGQLLAIAAHTTLYSVIGIRFGGDGRSNFALPNMSGCAPMNQGHGPGLTNRTVGETVGSATVSLIDSEMPVHTHTANAAQSYASATVQPINHFWGEPQPEGRPPHEKQANIYSNTPNVEMSALALSTAGGSQPHNNMQPYLPLNFIICLDGYYPPRP